MTHPVLAAINDALERNQEDGMRAHLGASIIGRECNREIWYSFRWATAKRFAGRMLRLFNRGHLEENRFVTWLTEAGINVAPVDPATNEQWRITGCNKHFGGSLDAIAWNVPGVEHRCLLEFKTHNDKSFAKLVIEGVKKSKPEHFTQMQTYMFAMGIANGLYLAINKNTDEIHAEFVQYDGVTGAMMLDKAQRIIDAPTPPPRISEDPSWFKCRMCDHRGSCHLREPLAKNCRTCIYAHPIGGGEWHCARHNSVIPLEEQKKQHACHTPIQ